MVTKRTLACFLASSTFFRFIKSLPHFEMSSSCQLDHHVLSCDTHGPFRGPLHHVNGAFLLGSKWRHAKNCLALLKSVPSPALWFPFPFIYLLGSAAVNQSLVVNSRNPRTAAITDCGHPPSLTASTITHCIHQILSALLTVLSSRCHHEAAKEQRCEQHGSPGIGEKS